MHQKNLLAARTGAVLGAAVLGSLLTAAPDAAAAGVSCATNVYTQAFYKNTSFSGSPVKTVCDTAISQNWSGRPATGVPADKFSVRWSVTRDFGSGGPFTFKATATDGVRVYLDGVRKVDLWTNTGSTARSKSVNLTVPAGRHRIRVDYVNWSGAAKIAFTYTPRTSAAYDRVKPLAPTGVNTAYDTATRRTTVSWAANKEMDLASYSLYRRPVDSTSWTKVATTTARAYTDPLVNPDDRTAYYYEVRAVDKAGNVSSGSTDVIVRPLPEVSSLTGAYDEATGEVALKWALNTEPQFDHYTVLSYDYVEGYYRWVPLGTTKQATWTTGPVTADGEWRHYRILVTNDGGTTTFSSTGLIGTANELWLSVPDRIAPSNMPSLTLSLCTGGVQATATDSTPSVFRDYVGFEIERREAGTATWSVVLHKTFDPRLAYATATVCDPVTYDGRTYEYRTRTYDAAGNYSPPSDTGTVTVPVG